MQQESMELSLRDVVRVVRSAWLGIVLLTVMGGVIAAVLAYTTEPVYRAATVLSPASSPVGGRSALSRLAEQFAPGLAGGLDSIGGFSGKEVWLATLRSRRLAEAFISEKNLLPILFYEQWDEQKGQWKIGKNGKPAVPTMHKACDYFNDNVIKVSEDRRTGLVTLSVQWRDPERAAEWANDLVARANEFIRARMIQESQEGVDFLQAELKKTNIVELQQVIYHLMETKISEMVVANVRKEYAFAVVDPAVAPSQFIKPRRRFMLACGLLLGFCAGAVYSVIKWMAGAKLAGGKPTMSRNI